MLETCAILLCCPGAGLVVTAGSQKHLDRGLGERGQLRAGPRVGDHGPQGCRGRQEQAGRFRLIKQHPYQP